MYHASHDCCNFWFHIASFCLYLYAFAAPGTVENITLTAKGNTITVSWDLPQCSTNIDNIRVQYKKKAQITYGWEIQTKSASDVTIAITGLETGAEYEVRVIVVDINGQQHAMKAAGTAKPTKPGIYVH